MNVANLELCKELYELSGWEHDYFWYDDVKNQPFIDQRMQSIRSISPAYPLGYLLRKLPQPNMVGFADGSAYAMAMGGQHQEADTPEDAACKLAIELFKQGVLKR